MELQDILPILAPIAQVIRKVADQGPPKTALRQSGDISGINRRIRSGGQAAVRHRFSPVPDVAVDSGCLQGQAYQDIALMNRFRTVIGVFHDIVEDLAERNFGPDPERFRRSTRVEGRVSPDQRMPDIGGGGGKPFLYRARLRHTRAPCRRIRSQIRPARDRPDL
ncbi:MAG: hypothetical protein RIB61_11220 [Roseicyclus sp.]